MPQIIRTAALAAQEGQLGSKYTLLLILTDGVISGVFGLILV